MINLPTRIKNDLSGNLTNVEYLVAIKTDPIVYIGTTKQMFESTEGAVGFGGNLINEDFSDQDEYFLSTHQGSGGTYEYIIRENPSPFKYQIRWLGLTDDDWDCGKPQHTDGHPNGRYCDVKWNDILEIGSKYRVTVNCTYNEGTRIMVNQIDPYHEVVPEGQIGEFTIDFVAENRNDFILYSPNYDKEVIIDKVIVQKQEQVYYEDLDLRLSNIKEKIDLKTKKIQISTMSMSFSNYPVNGVRLSDRIANGLGKDVSVYMKTQSCRNISDCIKVADLKINRYTHDKNIVKITADDKFLESFYVDLPKNILEKDINTFDKYNTKPIPMLYGHLKTAPAVVYIDDMNVQDDYNTNPYQSNNIWVIPDDLSTNIRGIKYKKLTNIDYMLDNDSLQIKIGSQIHEVPMKDFHNSNYDLQREFGTFQYVTFDNYVRLTTGSEYTNVMNKNAVWVSSTEYKKHIKSYKWVLYEGPVEGNTYPEYGHFEEMPVNVDDDQNKIVGLESVYTGDTNNVTGIGLVTFEFDPLDSSDRFEVIEVDDEGYNKPRVLPIDVCLVGNFELKTTNVTSDVDKIPYIQTRFVADSFKYTSAAVDSSSKALLAGLPSYINSNYLEVSELERLFRWKNWKLEQDSNTEKVFTSSEQFKDFYNNTIRAANYITNSSFKFLNNKFHEDYIDRVGDYELSLESNIVSMYISHSDGEEYTGQDRDDWAFDVTPEFKTIGLKRTWCEKDLFSKELFVHARGRVSDDVLITDYGNVQEVQASVYCVLDDIDSSKSRDRHFSLIEKTFRENRYVYSGDNIYQAMFRINNNKSCIFDVDINSIKIEDEVDSHPFNVNDETFIGNKIYKIEISGLIAQLNDTQLYSSNGVNQTELQYGNIQYDIANPNKITNIVKGEVQGWNDANYDGGNFTTTFGKTNIVIESINGDATKVIESAPEILKHLATKELGITSYNQEKLITSINEQGGSKYAFSINKTINSRKIIENLCKQSNLFFKYNPANGNAVIDSLKTKYTESDKVINTSKILKYSFNKTKIDDLCFGGCRVKYGYDYGRGEISNITEELVTTQIELYKDYYGVDDHEKYKLEVEAPYIDNEATAKRLRNYLFNFYKNQHLIIKFTLPIQEGIELQTGDIIQFDKDIDDIKPYGQSIIINWSVVDQIIYKYFIITSISKNLEKIDIEVMQLHDLYGLSLEDGYDIIDDPVVEDDEILPDDDTDDEEIEVVFDGLSGVEALVVNISDGQPSGTEQCVPGEHSIKFTALLPQGSPEAAGYFFYYAVYSTNEEIGGIETDTIFSPSNTFTFTPDPELYIDNAIIIGTCVGASSLEETGSGTPADQVGDTFEFSVDILGSGILPDDTDQFVDFHEINTYVIDDESGLTLTQNYMVEDIHDLRVEVTANVLPYWFIWDYELWDTDEDGNPTNISTDTMPTLENAFQHYDQSNTFHWGFTSGWSMDYLNGKKLRITCEASGFELDEDGNLDFTSPTSYPNSDIWYSEFVTLYNEAPFSTIPGDVNQDGAVDVLDIVLIVQHILGNLELDEHLNEQAKINADFTQDGLVDILDIVSIVSQVLEG